LPWIAAQVLDLMRKPSRRPALILAAELTALGILDLHLLIPASLLLIVATVAFGIARRADRLYLNKLCKETGLALVTTAVVSSYWLIPLLAGSNSQGRTIVSVRSGDLAAYSASADPVFGLIPNLLGLYGFWAEETGRFTSMKAFVPLWPVILLVLIGLAALGAKAAIQRWTEIDFAGGRPWVWALLGAGVIA